MLAPGSRPRRSMLCSLSYALTMIPDWFCAVDNALSMLRAGGRLCVVDFYVSRHAPAPGLVRHGTLRRVFWPLRLAHDGVFLSPDQLPYLMARCECMHLEEHFGTVPYLPTVRIPYYVFVGRVRTQEPAAKHTRADAGGGRSRAFGCAMKPALKRRCGFAAGARACTTARGF